MNDKSLMTFHYELVVGSSPCSDERFIHLVFQFSSLLVLKYQ